MKKLIILSLSLLAFNVSHSQLLRSEIYDFAIGDYYGIRHVSNQSGQFNDVTWKVQMFHVLTKQLSVGGDTVTYSAQRQTYFPPIGGSSPLLQIDTFQFSHFNLNAVYSPSDNDLTFGNSLEKFWYGDTTSCYSQDSSLSNSTFCSGVIDQRFDYTMQLNIMDSCYSIEPFLSEYVVFSNAGGPYGGKYNPGEPTYVKNLIHLEYVNHNGIECGAFPDYFLGLKELEPLIISVFPNPAMDKLAVSGIDGIKSFRVVTSDGRIVDNLNLDTMNSLDVSKLTEGIYFLHLTDNQDRIGVVRFIKNW